MVASCAWTTIAQPSRCNESEPADSCGHKSNPSSGWFRPLTLCVHKHEPMSASRRRFAAAAIFSGLLVFLIGRFTSFEPLWHGLKDGMTESEVGADLPVGLEPQAA